ncbi:branched-chain-amino-acid transaminase [Candidatus Sumerlaeota bacterium]|nr:branched-chain-amino-acid transaminase [Candidatus Sumerlaeota bacterium]
MSPQIYIDGKFYDQADAKVSVFDHTFLYGDGVFEGIRIYDGNIFRLQQHLERLYDSARYIMLEIPLKMKELAEATAETVRRNQLKSGYIRLVVSRGVGTLGLAPWNCKGGSIVIIADKITLYSDETYKKGMKLMTVPSQRMGPAAFNPRVKSCNYLNNIMAKIEAHNAGFEEALMLDDKGFVIECSGDNVFVIKKKVITTPPTYLGAMRGITRDCFIEIARAKGYEVREEPFTRYEVFTADECFLTGTAAEAIPVVEVDQRPIADGKPGPITQKLIAEFRKRTTKDGLQVYK